MTFSLPLVTFCCTLVQKMVTYTINGWSSINQSKHLSRWGIIFNKALRIAELTRWYFWRPVYPLEHGPVKGLVTFLFTPFAKERCSCLRTHCLILKDPWCFFCILVCILFVHKTHSVCTQLEGTTRTSLSSATENLSQEKKRGLFMKFKARGWMHHLIFRDSAVRSPRSSTQCSAALPPGPQRAGPFRFNTSQTRAPGID